MADRPEPLRLFDPDPQGDETRSSQPKTGAELSPSETRQVPSRSETRSNWQEGQENPLHAVAEAATMVGNADRHLDAAIEAARAAGRSWREIGIASGVPYQTLHRRHRKEERDDVTP
jgi:hypothetical protein